MRLAEVKDRSNTKITSQQRYAAQYNHDPRETGDHNPGGGIEMRAWFALSLVYAETYVWFASLDANGEFGERFL